MIAYFAVQDFRCGKPFHLCAAAQGDDGFPQTGGVDGAQGLVQLHGQLLIVHGFGDKAKGVDAVAWDGILLHRGNENDAHLRVGFADLPGGLHPIESLHGDVQKQYVKIRLVVPQKGHRPEARHQFNQDALFPFSGIHLLLSGISILFSIA